MVPWLCTVAAPLAAMPSSSPEMRAAARPFVHRAAGAEIESVIGQAGHDAPIEDIAERHGAVVTMVRPASIRNCPAVALPAVPTSMAPVPDMTIVPLPARVGSPSETRLPDTVSVADAPRLIVA